MPLFFKQHEKMCKEFAMEMKKKFEMYILSELSLLLGLHISHIDKGIFISQTKYIKEMLKKFKMEYCASVRTPMATVCKLIKYDEPLELNKTVYMSMITILLYVIASIPSIT